MNIYLISQTHNNDYDTFDSAVVVAATEDEARQMRLCSYDHYTWCAPEFVTVKLIGSTDLPAGTVVCASFNAG